MPAPLYSTSLFFATVIGDGILARAFPSKRDDSMDARALRRMLMSSLLVGSILFSSNTLAETSNEKSRSRLGFDSPESLYEARNWMPRASDVNSTERVLDGKQRHSKGKKMTSKTRTKKRLRRNRARRLNLAQHKAMLAARIGIARLIKPNRPAHSIAPLDLRHVGKHLGLGGGNLEGAGFSARSPSEALAVCSFSQYGFPVLYQGVAKGRDGYFAYKIYRR